MIGFNIKAMLFTLFALLIFSVGNGFGQTVTGTISGTVKDSSGAVLPGTKISLLNQDTGTARAVQADAAGHYSASTLNLGNYRVTATQDGFQTQVRSGIVLSVGQEAVVDLTLSVGAVTQTVEVTGQAAAVETTNATVSGLVDTEQLRNLPLNGRSVDKLALLSPGAIANLNQNNVTAMGFGMRLSVDGGRQDANVFLIDGTVVNDHDVAGPNSAAGQALGVEGILEFRVLTHNFSAEYGRNSGAVVSQVTRSGTNDFHGSAYEFVRNNVFDARNFFNPGDLPAFRRNQFGASIGGHIIKDKLFFFGNYEGLRQRQGVTVIGSVPDDNSRQGLVPCSAAPTVACNTATNQAKVPVNPIVVPYLALWPRANGPGFGDGTAKYTANFTQPATENYAMERVDYRLSDKDSFYGRYIFSRSSAQISRPLPTFVDAISGGNNFFVLSESHIFSARSVNEFRAAYNRTHPTGVGVPTMNIDPSLSFVPGQPFGAIRFQFNTAGNGITQGVSETGLGVGRGTFPQNIFQESDTFSTIRGLHSLKFGVDVERIQLNTNGGAPEGAYQFGGLVPFLAGTPTQFTANLLGGNYNVERGWRRMLFGWFVQDDFRIRPNLTLNLGLRHEFFTSPSEVLGKMGTLINVTDPAETQGTPFHTSKLTFSPRVGLAWDPFGDGKTSIRTGAGIFYNFIDGRTWYIAGVANSLFSPSVAINNPAFPHALASGSPLGAQAITDIVNHPDEPTVIHYNLDVQRQLTRSLSMRVGYVGSNGYHMARLQTPNTRPPVIQSDGTPFYPATGPLINPNFSTMMRILTDAHYNYNAFQGVLQNRLSAGLTFQASYTYGKSMSDADQITNSAVTSSAASTLDPNHLSRDYSLSSFDQRHTLVLNGAYKMPWDARLKNGIAKGFLGGWAVNGIWSWGSGLPFDIATGFNNSRDSDPILADRPNLNPGFSPNPISGLTAGCLGIPVGQQLKSASRWFDPCAFSLQTAGTYGNLGRNTVTAPGLQDVDAALVKSTALAERTRLEFRAEAFNILNHANFGVPARSIFNSNGTRNGSAGIITTTATSNRQMQLGLKLIF
jgi:hypothetical protein